MANGYYIGIEAGSRTVALLANPAGEVVGRGTAGPSTYASVGTERCSQALWTAIIGAFSAAGINARDLLASESALPEVEAICVGMPGIERPKEESAVKRIFADFNLTQKVQVTSDAHIVLMAGVPAGYGLAIMAGDNGYTLGIGRNGAKARAGGWGYLLGEEGSAYWVGLEAVKAILAATDGRGPETLLAEWLAKEWKIPANRPDALSRQVYSLSAGLGTGGNKAQLEETLESYKRSIGVLAIQVERAAQKGDEAAANILDRAAEALENAASASISKANLEQLTTAAALFDATWILKGAAEKPKIPLAFSGTLLLSNQGELRHRLTERLETRCAAPVLVTDPAEGALRLALQN